MNQKDYKEIAFILKQYKNANEDNRRSSNIVSNVSVDLADYFEREESIMVFKKDKFNTQQFLKDCGVK